MNIPFGPPGGPIPENPEQHAGFGFGPATPHQRRAAHAARRQARREFRRHLREQGAEHCAPFGFDPGHDVGSRGFGPDFRHGPGFGPGFGPGGPGFGFGFGFGPSGHRGHRRGHRGRRGDVRLAILALLGEGPMHGYEIIQQIAERSQGLWRPSPGSVYPTLQMLVDEGLITGSETDGKKRLFELTEDGRAAAEKIEIPPWEHIADGVDPGQINLRTATGQLFGAVAQAGQAATPEQQQRIVDIVNNARKEIYGILGETD
ncbi:PadR family transcriptional regulator [Mycolicibacter longobardus]|uniref:PadR family transcriptional regulator n=1 Tax=Mycolicibacter longobardus TaxID=1108812 RepID=A0A1X1YEX2_9MYCO|nr:PadR family transcriptional regulator [Mycolicibacter longobardus]MCV7385963.1 helix-turn-helix transcriptional regulator [Mycolicibacter longobardus]ORW09682.1 PadR family transcriptional regulator [Mycolicibacter longobardus]